MTKLAFLVVLGCMLTLCSIVNVKNVSAQEPDDPFLWLEEVTGDKPLAWAKERNAERVAELAELRAYRGRRQIQNLAGP